MSKKRSMRWRPFVAAWVAASLFALLHVGSELSARPWAVLSDLEQGLLDLRFRLRGPLVPGEDVALVVIDDVTMAEAPELFERRRGFASLLEKVKRAGARVVVLDLLFAKEEALLPPSQILAIDELLERPASGDDEPWRPLLEEVRREATGDDALERTLRDAGNVLLAFHLGDEGVAAGTAETLEKGTYGQVIPGPALPELSSKALTSLPRFMAAAQAAGLLTVWADPITGRVWSLPLARRIGPRVYAPLSLMAVALYESKSRADLAYLGTEGIARVGEHEVRGHRGNLLLNFRGPPGTFPTHSALDVAQGKVGRRELEGRVVLVGFTHLAQDRAATPFGARTPGLEVHATAIDNVLRGDALARAPLVVDLLLALLAGLLVALLFGARRLGAVGQGAGAAFAALLVVAGAQLAFQQGWVVAEAPALLGVISATGAGLLVSYLLEGRGRQQLRQTFSRYLSAELLDELLDDPERLSLSGERRNVTSLFTDIRGFTTLAEKTTPLELSAFLNRFFTPMSRAVLEQRGYLDKYIGDAIMAVFGAPVPRAEHAVDACRAALAMQRALVELKASGDPLFAELGGGVGINTGEAVVGNFGSEERFDYTVIGDSVNLASRLEGLTKRYGVFCLVGEQTRAEVGDDVPGLRFRAVDLVRVKGKDRPEAIFELGTEALPDEERWSAFMQAWRAGALEKARTELAAFRASHPDDPVAQVYAERLVALGGEVPEGWDGVFTHDEK